MYIRFVNPTWATSWFLFFYFFRKSINRFYLSNHAGGINFQMFGSKYEADSLPW